MKDPLSICHLYLDARRSVIEAGFGWELDWQAGLSTQQITEQRFLKEYSWVVFNAGFRERTMRHIFPSLEQAFLGWKSALEVWEQRRVCRRTALHRFRNIRKVDAVLETCRKVASYGFDGLREEIKVRGAEALYGLPFMGPVTSLHLVKNLGIDVVKPDRHLLRLAAATGYRTPLELCQTVRDHIGDTLAEIDLVFWRFLTLQPGWLKSHEPEGNR